MQTLSSILQFPVSALLGVCFIMLTFLTGKYAAGNRVVRVLASAKTGAAVMAAAALMIALEGVWGWPVHKSAVFAITALLLQFCLGLAVSCKQARTSKPAISCKQATLRFRVIHLGMLIMVWAGFWGSPDVTKAQMTLDQTPSNIAHTHDGHALLLPFQLSLDEFTIDHYDDGVSPRQFTSKLSATGLNGQDVSNPGATDAGSSVKKLTTSVNHPARYHGYRIYQASYGSNYTVLELVKDPWLPLVYLGMVLMATGCAAMLSGKWKLKILLPALLVLATIFSVATVAKISFGTLPPALRSLWFVPHLIIYMVAYSAMAIAVALAAADAVMIRKGKSATLSALSDKLLRTASVLLLFGMLCGCVWAKQAWGDYWNWDPKECWAAVTWLLTLIYLHPFGRHRRQLQLAALTAAFLALQLTWYGVNYLPSAKESMHTYNSK